MRRYSLQSFMCVGAEDLDAEDAMDRPKIEQKPINKTQTKGSL
jgi:hypothetical protein